MGKTARKDPSLQENEKFLAELSPEMAEKCEKAFPNVNAIIIPMTNCNKKDQFKLMGAKGLEELPVIMMLLEVTASARQKIGTMINLASDTNFITLVTG